MWHSDTTPTHLDFFGCSGCFGLLLEPLFILQRRRRPAGLGRADDGSGAVYRLHICPTRAQWLTPATGLQYAATGGRGGTRLTLLAVSWLRRLHVWVLLVVRSHGRVERLSSHDGRRWQFLFLQRALARRSSLLQDKQMWLQVRRNIGVPHSPL